MKICPVCNKENEKGSYCTQCGAPLTDKQDNGDTVDMKEPVIKNNSNIVEKPSATKFIIILLVAVVCCILAVVLIQKKAQSVKPTITKENTEKFVEDMFDNDASGSTDNSDVEQSEESVENTVNEDYILPDSDSRYLDNEDIAHLSKEELRLARNEIYARHGRKFDDVSLQEYFNSKDWYSGTISPSDFTENMLNDYEIQNAYMISDYESEMGYK